MSGDLPQELLDVEPDLFEDESELDEDGDGEDLEEELAERERRERFIVFRIGGESYGAPVMQVRQVVETVERTRVPRTAKSIYGVMDLRGEITVVIDPWVHLRVPDGPADWEDQLVLVFNTGEEQQPAGIRIDDIIGVEGFPAENVDYELDDDDRYAGNPLIGGVVERVEDDEVVERIGLLDPDAVIRASSRHPHLAV